MHARPAAILALLLTLVAAAATASELGGTYSLDWHSIDTGGGESAGGTYTLFNTMGQHDAGPLAGGVYQLDGGFLAPPPSGTCPADTTGDGTVNIDDLLDLLAAWGSCPAPCPEDVDGDGQVNIDDLLSLLGAWGGCP